MSCRFLVHPSPSRVLSISLPLLLIPPLTPLTPLTPSHPSHSLSLTLITPLTGTPSLKRRFEQNQQDCTLTLLSLLPTIVEDLFTKMNVEQLTEQLKRNRQSTTTVTAATTATTTTNTTSTTTATATANAADSDEARQAKLEMWERLKIYSRFPPVVGGRDA